MSELQPYSDPAALNALPVSPGPVCCGYCGRPLDGRYYFCTSCATPYIDEEGVLPRVRPEYLSEGKVIERRVPQALTLFWTYLGAVLGAAVLGTLIWGDTRLDLRLLAETLVIFVTTCVVASLYWRSLLPQLLRPGLHWATLAGLPILAALLCVNYGYHHWLIYELGAKPGLGMDELHKAGLSQVTLVFVFCVFPAVTEEIAFRGLLQNWLQVALRPWRAILIAAALFTALHFNVVSAPYLFCVGILLGWTKWKTNSLYPGMLLHFLHNLVVIEFFRL